MKQRYHKSPRRSTHPAVGVRELAAALAIASSVGATLDLPALLRVILDQLKQVVDYTSATLWNIEGTELVAQARRGLISDLNVQSIRVGVETPGWRRVVRHQKPLIVPDVQADTPMAQLYRSTVGEEVAVRFAQVRSWLVVPLLINGHVIGALSLEHERPAAYRDRHARLAATVATQAAIAIENARLFEQARTMAALIERQRMVRELHDGVVQELYGVVLGVRTARTLVEVNSERAAQALDYVLAAAEAGMGKLRALLVES